MAEACAPTSWRGYATAVWFRQWVMGHGELQHQPQYSISTPPAHDNGPLQCHLLDGLQLPTCICRSLHHHTPASRLIAPTASVLTKK